MWNGNEIRKHKTSQQSWNYGALKIVCDWQNNYEEKNGSVSKNGQKFAFNSTLLKLSLTQRSLMTKLVITQAHYPTKTWHLWFQIRETQTLKMIILSLKNYSLAKSNSTSTIFELLVKLVPRNNTLFKVEAWQGRQILEFLFTRNDHYWTHQTRISNFFFLSVTDYQIWFFY